MLLLHNADANAGGIYNSIIASSAAYDINPPANSSGTSFTSNDPTQDHILNPIDSKNNHVMHNYFKLVKKRRFSIEAGQTVKYSMSYSPKRLLSGLDLYPEAFSGNTSATPTNGLGMYLFAGLSRVLMFQVFGELVSNSTGLDAVAPATVMAMFKCTRTVHFVAPTFTAPTQYTEWFNGTATNAAAGSLRTMQRIADHYTEDTAGPPNPPPAP